MRCTIEIEMDNAAFSDDGEDGRAELGRTLAELASDLEAGINSYVIRDINGNKVGKAVICD